jgi:hypothetical protein
VRQLVDAGGNVKLNLADMAVTRVSADTGGGNMDVVLPDNAANLSADAKTGAGNVTVEIGSGITGSNTVDANSGAGNVAILVPGSIAAKMVNLALIVSKAVIDNSFWSAHCEILVKQLSHWVVNSKLMPLVNHTLTKNTTVFSHQTLRHPVSKVLRQGYQLARTTTIQRLDVNNPRGRCLPNFDALLQT